MDSGIRAEVSIDSPETCPIVLASGESEVPSYSISRSTDPRGTGTVVEEFTLDADADPDLDGFDVRGVSNLRPVFAYGTKDAYRFERERGSGCPCERIEAFDAPVVDLHTREGALFLAFHTTSMDELSEIFANVREHYPSMQVRRLLQSKAEHEEYNLVFVDRSRLTERQREVLATAHRMGYFEHPKEANAGEVADELGISPSTFAEHLAAAQRKLFDAIVDA